jgi:hypothetical protein
MQPILLPFQMMYDRLLCFHLDNALCAELQFYKGKEKKNILLHFISYIPNTY